MGKIKRQKAKRGQEITIFGVRYVFDGASARDIYNRCLQFSAECTKTIHINLLRKRDGLRQRILFLELKSFVEK